MGCYLPWGINGNRLVPHLDVHGIEFLYLFKMNNMLEVPAYDQVRARDSSDCNMPGVITIIARQYTVFEICFGKFDGFGRERYDPICTLPEFGVNLFDFLWRILDLRVDKLRQKQLERLCLKISEQSV